MKDTPDPRLARSRTRSRDGSGDSGIDCPGRATRTRSREISGDSSVVIQECAVKLYRNRSREISGDYVKHNNKHFDPEEALLNDPESLMRLFSKDRNIKSAREIAFDNYQGKTLENPTPEMKRVINLKEKSKILSRSPSFVKSLARRNSLERFRSEEASDEYPSYFTPSMKAVVEKRGERKPEEVISMIRLVTENSKPIAKRPNIRRPSITEENELELGIGKKNWAQVIFNYIRGKYN